MATDAEFGALLESGEIRLFRNKQHPAQIIGGRVTGRGQSVVSTSQGKAEQSWVIENDSGGTDEIWSGGFDILDASSGTLKDRLDRIGTNARKVADKIRKETEPLRQHAREAANKIRRDLGLGPRKKP